jgi:hypothetical protein
MLKVIEADIKKRVVCCFCGEGITSSPIDPCSINILINWDKSEDKQYSQDGEVKHEAQRL